MRLELTSNDFLSTINETETSPNYGPFEGPFFDFCFRYLTLLIFPQKPFLELG